jgi:hypothetical protein
MAEPKLQIEQRVEQIEKTIDNLLQWLVKDSKIDFDGDDYQELRDILNGTAKTASEARPDATT